MIRPYYLIYPKRPKYHKPRQQTISSFHRYFLIIRIFHEKWLCNITPHFQQKVPSHFDFFQYIYCINNRNYCISMETIWVIGGAGYLGQAIIRNLIDKGYRVLCADINDKAHHFAEELKDAENLIPISLDASDEENIHQFVSENIQNYGIPDGLVVLTYGAAGKNFYELNAD